MSRFTVTPGAPYTLGVTEPQVAGTPTPTISYAWTFNNQPIGSARFVPSYVFSAGGLPGVLRCVITISNIAGSVSRTLEASVLEAVPVPSLQRVTIRNAASPSEELTALDNNSGITVFAGGPSPADLAPVGQNFTSLTYQWLRNGEAIAGQTSQTYTLVEADNDSTIAVRVTVSDATMSSSRTASVAVGVTGSSIGSHAPEINYFGSEAAFANLIYASVKDPFTLVRGLNGQGRLFFGSDRYLDWTGPAYYTADGWPYRSDAGPLSRSNAVHINLVWAGAERMWSVLGLRGGFDTPPVALLDENGRVQYPRPRGIAGRSFSFKATCYWEGQGIAVAGRGQVPLTPQVQTVEFAGPQGQGPFGDGPRTMRSSTVQFTASGDDPGGLLAYIVESDSTGVDPLRNLIVLISDVRDATTNELIYPGFDHTTYRPFQLYPDWVESMRHCSHLRSLHNDFAHGTPKADQIIHEDTGLEYQWHQESHGSTHLLKTGWSRSAPSAPGFDRGFAAINRPTHVGFGNSLRAIIEMCNQLDADLWWCHPAPTVFVGTRQGSAVTYARLRGQNATDPNQVGSILIDEEYVHGFTQEIEQHLKPGLKVYSEWVNEIWNAASNFVWATRYAWTSAMRTLASVEYGGDGALWFAQRTLTAPAIYAGVELKADANVAMAAFSAAASSTLAEAIRDRLGPETDREIVCVAAGQSNFPRRSARGLGQFWAAMPYLFKQLDAVAHAPYRDPILVWPHNSVESDRNLVEDLATASGAWDAYEAADMLVSPLKESSWWTTSVREDGVTNLNYGNFLVWKHLALDHPRNGGSDVRNSYSREFTPSPWPATQRRWNLDLLTYEGGTHSLPGYQQSEYRTSARLLMYGVVLEPRNSLFYQRYLETTFMPGPKGLTRDPASASEEALYRHGMVPMGVVENAEPLHDRFTFLITTGEPSFRHGMFWSLQWWNGQMDSPPAEGAKEAVRFGVGRPDWWLTYEGID